MKSWISQNFRIFDSIPVRLRLSLGHAITIGVVLLGIGIGISRVVEKSIMDSLDASLLTSAKAIRDASLSPDVGRNRLRNSPFWRSILDEFYDGSRLAIRSYAQMIDVSGRVSARTGPSNVRLPVTPQAVARAEKALETFETFLLNSSSRSKLRQVTLPHIFEGRFTGELIQVGAPMDSTLRILSRLKGMLLISLSLALFVSVFFGHMLTRSAFRPVAKITNAAASFGVDNLSSRLPLPPASDELRTLTKTFNEMMHRLEDAFGRLRRFSGNVSHELRTPLAVVRGEAELALRRERSPERYRESLELILTESKHMSGIVEDLLLFARAQGKSLGLKVEEVNLQDLLEELRIELSRSISSKQVALNIRVESNPVVHASRGYLMIIFKNLLLNAIKYSPIGEAVEVFISGDVLISRVVVKDKGKGIADKDRPYIFDLFYRSDDARNRSLGGSGIGLSLTKALVELHGGGISVNANTDCGAIFEVQLPRLGKAER